MSNNTKRPAVAPPEVYILPPTAYVPNSPLPLLLYRNVLPQPLTEAATQSLLESHGWKRQGGLWTAVYRRHFHPNVHECYGIISGSSEVLMGVGKLDEPSVENIHELGPDSPGLRLTLNAGDVIVHPAGMSHSNISDHDNYRYISVFPEGSPHWISKNGDEVLDLDAVFAQTLTVPIPEDPVTGGPGFLKELWTNAREEYLAKRK